MQANTYKHKIAIKIFVYSERERQKIRRGQARRRNKRLCGQMCAHFKEVRRQRKRPSTRTDGGSTSQQHSLQSPSVSLSQEQIRIKNRTSLPRLYTLRHLKSSPITPDETKTLKMRLLKYRAEAQCMEQRSPSANCRRAVFFVGVPSEPS